MLESRLKEGDKRFQNEVVSLTTQLGDKNVELSDMRRKLNDLLEIKRRLEEETAALRFSLDNARGKMEVEIREKTIKLE